MADTRVQLSVGTAAEWAQYNPVLRAGELAIVIKTDGNIMLKVGCAAGGQAFSDAPVVWDKGTQDEMLTNMNTAATNAANSAKAAADSAQAASTTEATVDQKVSDAKASVQAQFDALGLSVVDGKLCVTYQKE